MNNTIYQLRRLMRQGLAATLFTLLLFGASAAALSAVAAGITALSGMRSAAQVVVTGSVHTGDASSGNVPTDPRGFAGQANGAAQSASQPQPTGLSNSTVTTTGSYVDELNHRLDHMESPIGHSLDSGGVALGAQVQRTFGRVLSGVLQTLFFERSVSSAQTGGQP